MCIVSVEQVEGVGGPGTERWAAIWKGSHNPRNRGFKDLRSPWLLTTTY